MRSKKATLSAITSITYEIVKIISAFLLPRLILDSFGSNTNGINQAVTQFIGYISLLAAGISSVTTAALYKPIANKNSDEISAIVNATEKFLRRISRIFVFALIIFALIFPVFINEFDFIFTFTLVLILGIGTFANYYFGLTYRMILNADQKQYISRFIEIIIMIVQTTVAVILINNKASIHTVQLISALIFSANPIVIYLYVKKNYKINKLIDPNYDAIDQRWDAFGHQIANLVNNNTDLIILTIFTNLKEVSVYSVYYLVFSGIRNMISSIIIGTEAAFGDMFAKGQINSIKQNLKLYELFLHFISIVLYSSMAILITSFVSLYTVNITDADYYRPVLGYLISIVGFFISARIPYQALTKAAGHFKQTRNGAIVEAILNIVLSLLLVIPFGVNGIIIGTLFATIFRTLQYGVYSSKKLLDRSFKHIVKRYIISIVNIATIILLIYLIPLKEINNFLDWIINGLFVTSIGIGVTFIFSFIFYFDDVIKLKDLFLRIIKIKK